MPIAITCSSCKRKLKAPDNAAGRKLKCPQCGSSIEVPEEDTEAEAPAVRQEIRPLKKRVRIVEDDEERDTSRDDDSTEDEKPSRTILYLAIGGSFLLITLTIVVSLLVFGRRDNKDRPDEDARSDVQAKENGKTPVPEKGEGNGTKNAPPRPTEEEAKSKLKLALDSWVFGDSPEKFQKDHPGIRVGVRLHSLDKLTRYEIGPSRTTFLGHEFVVTHVFEGSKGSEIRRTGKVAVNRFPEGDWLIQGLGGDD